MSSLLKKAVNKARYGTIQGSMRYTGIRPPSGTQGSNVTARDRADDEGGQPPRRPGRPRRVRRMGGGVTPLSP
ncbi:MAG: hypothetical protein AMJ84_00135 [Acidithiobacillales bacterium SM23_46]|nr:MAG: hypothetical protein AMJ84_00135 [Acidithiobacillales bacterium SM23_46]KPL29036.1 MAG: hypothetical protein AMJ72_00315 [Acidithiobacillales bacterium SM1_46]